MTISLPRPPQNLDPDVQAYLRELLQYIERALNDLTSNAQMKGDPVVLPIVMRSQLTANPGTYRAGQEGRVVLCSDGATSGSLAVSHDYVAGGNGPQWKEITLGPQVGP